MPVVFSPPRDGKQNLTEPVAIGGRELSPGSQPSEQRLQSEGGDASSTSGSTHALSDREGMDEQGGSNAQAIQMGLLSLHEEYSD